MALINSLTSGISALRSFSRGLEVIGNNVANVNSVGYKKSRMDYTESFSNLLRSSAPSAGGDAAGSNTPSQQIGTGVQIGGIITDHTQGAINPTGVKTDLAISGDGFFQIRDSVSQEIYATRAGNFRMDDRGFLVTQGGLRVQGLTGGSIAVESFVDPADTKSPPELRFNFTYTAPSEIGDVQIDYDPTFAAGDLTKATGAQDPSAHYTDTEIEALKPKIQNWNIDEQGSLNITLAGDVTPYKLGQVLLMNFRDPQALMSEGSNLFSGLSAAGPIGGATLTAANNAPGRNGSGAIISEALELSNTDLTEEFSNMITTQRSFQAGARIITVSDDVLQEVVNLKR